MHPDQKDHPSAAWIALVVSLPFVYAISVFPVAFLCEKLGMTSPPEWLTAIYQPLFKLVWEVPWLREAYSAIFQALGL